MKKFIQFSLIIVIFSSILLGAIFSTDIILINFIFIVIVSILWVIKSNKLNKTSLDIAIFILLLSFCSSTILTTTRYKSEIEFYKSIIYIIIYYLTVNNIINAKDRNTLLKAILIITFFISSYGIYQALYGFEELKKIPSINLPNRIFSTFIHPNTLAGYLILIIPVSIGFIYNEENFILKFLYILIFLVIIIAFILTFSVGGFISALPIFIVLIVYLIRRNFKLTIILFTIPILILPFFMLLKKPSSIKAAINTLKINVKKTSVEGRFSFWDGAIRVTKNNLLLGSGLNTFGIVYPSYRKNAFYSVYSHNHYLETSSNQGLLGLFSLLFIFTILVLKFIYQHPSCHPCGSRDRILPQVRNDNSHSTYRVKDYNLISFCIFLSIVGTLIHSFIDFDLSILPISVIFWLYLGLLSSTKAEYQTNIFLKIIITIILFILIILSLRYYLSYIYSQKGISLKDKNKIEEAILNFKKSIIYNKYNTSSYIALAKIKEDDYYINRVKELEPYNYLIYAEAALIYLKKGEYNRVIDELIKAKKLCNYCVDYNFNLAKVYVKLDRIDDAIEELKEIIEFKDELKIAQYKIDILKNSYSTLSKIYYYKAEQENNKKYRKLAKYYENEAKRL